MKSLKKPALLVATVALAASALTACGDGDGGDGGDDKSKASSGQANPFGGPRATDGESSEETGTDSGSSDPGADTSSVSAFCATIMDLPAPLPEDPAERLAAVQAYGQKLADVGPPSDMPQDAQEQLGSAIDTMLSATEDEVMSDTFLDGDTPDFERYLTDSCMPTSPDDASTPETIPSIPTDLPSDVQGQLSDNLADLEGLQKELDDALAELENY